MANLQPVDAQVETMDGGALWGDLPFRIARVSLTSEAWRVVAVF
jgi:hypothetical protein